jgi:LPXTG-site transpeptidase (sortase) family protein
MNKKNSATQIFGCLPKGILGNFAIGAAALLLSIWLGGPKIYIEETTAIVTFCILLVLYLAITWWSIYTLAEQKAKENLIISGPYKFTRNPMYGAIIFILNPALGILFRSWFLLLATILAYFFWKKCLRSEEAQLEEKFGNAYLNYKKATPAFFPNLYRANRPVFYAAAALLLFAGVFVFLNFSALYLRWVIFEKHQSITYDEPITKTPSVSPGAATPDFFGQLPQSTQRANYSQESNSIIISKLGIKVPLVGASGTTQNELNAALNQGAIIYPGSALPGQNGDVAISGHSSVYPWNKTPYGQIFALLDKLEAGDTVSIIYEHYQYDYRITGKEVMAPNNVKISTDQKPTLKLITCWPIGTSAKRLVIFGELIK